MPNKYIYDKENTHILVCLSNPSSMGGAERVTINLCNTLSDLGYKITLAGKFNDNLSTYFPLNDKVYLVNIDKYYNKQPLAKKLLNTGVIIKHKLYKLCKKRKKILITRYRFLNKIIWHLQFDIKIATWKCIVNKTKPDIVIGILPSSFTSLSIALKNSEIPLITSNHNNPWKDFSLSRFNANPIDLEYRLNALSIATTNTVLLPEFINFFNKKIQEKTYVIPNVVFPIPETEHANPNKTDGTKVIISTGRLTDVKDHKTLILAFNLIKSEFPDWVIKIFGSGPNHEILETLINSNNLKDSVFLCGCADDLNFEYKSAQILAIPSYFEGWGLSLTEGMSYGLPAVGFSNSSGVNSLIENGVTGILADGTNRVDNLASSLRKLMQNNILRAKMGSAGIKATKKYTPKIVYNLWDDLIKETINIYNKTKQ